jgi:putative serine protease PepD
MNQTHEAWQGLGTPAGPQIGWAAPQPTSGPVPVRPPLPPSPAASRSSSPPPVRSRSRPRLATVLAAAILAGGASGAGVVVALDRGAQAAGPTIVQERAPANGSASAGSTEAAARQVLPSVVQVRAGRGSGSGVVMDREGHVLTNHHVVSGASSVRLVLSSGRTVTAEVVGSDADDDIAVLRANAGALRAARLGVSADLRIGQPVIAVGSPLGLNGTVTSGIISALNRGATAESMIQTDASINPGNSGGPLVDLDGRVVGINTSIATLSGRGSGNIGIGFAVPIDRALDVARQILARG